MTYSRKQEKRVTIQDYQPTAASLLAILKDHAESTDTQLTEWTVDIERKPNEVLSTMMVPTHKYRWEITLTRNIL